MEPYSETVPGAMVVAALEAMGSRLDVIDIAMRATRSDSASFEYRAELSDGSELILIVGRFPESLHQICLRAPYGGEHFMALTCLRDAVKANLHGPGIGREPVLGPAEIPVAKNFIDRLIAAGLAAEGGDFTLQPALIDAIHKVVAEKPKRVDGAFQRSYRRRDPKPA